MTKRVLSLLLALVMALSLCVPAFAAEAPVDEAEEVGAEVVDAPAEVAVDEPAEVAADEPAAIDYQDEGVLQALVNQANGIKAGIIAGDYQDAAVDWPQEFKDGKYEMNTTGVATYFLAKLEDAEDVLGEIRDAGGYHVWYKDANIQRFQDAVTSLTTALNLVTAYVRNDNTAHKQVDDLNLWLSQYKFVIAENESYGTGTYDVQPWFEADIEEALAFLKGMTGYTKDGFTTKALYKDYKAAKAVHDKLWAQLTAGGPKNPEYTDYIELRDAIDQARNKLATCDYFDLGDYPNVNATVLGDHANLIAAMKAMEARTDDTAATGFKAGVTLMEVHAWLTAISDNLKKDNHSLKLDYFFITPDYKSVWAQVVDASGWKTDSHSYQIKISSTEKAVAPSAVFTAYFVANGGKGDNYSAMGASAEDLGIADQGKLKNGAVITAQLVCADCGKVIDTKTITVNDEYNGPEITSATYTPDTITVKLSKSMKDSNGDKQNNFDHNQYNDATLTLSYNGTVVETQHITGWDTVFKFNLKPVQLGDYTVELKVEEGKASGHVYTWKSRGTETVTVPNITAYVGVAGTDTTWKLAGATGYDNLLLAISSASKTENLLAKNGDTTKLLKQLADNVAEAQVIVDNAATTPDSIANEKKVDAAIAALYAILKNFDKAADASALTAAIAAGEALVPSDYDGAAEWKALQDAIAAGKAIKLPLADIKANQKIIADAAAKILAAIAELNANHLVVPTTELASLKALIESVPTRLAADDFSAESKAAVNAAVAAAKPLLDKTGVKKSEVNAAIDALQTALNNLTTVKSDAIPACPVGNGWAQAENGDYYYYDKNGKLVVNDWVSSKGLWYHMGATGKMDTGFIHIVDKWGDGWYYLNPSNTKGTMGRMFTGWKMINDSSAGAWGWFETRSNGHQGQCTYTTNWGDFKNYKPF